MPNISFNLKFNSDTAQARADLNSLRRQLEDIISDPIRLGDIDTRQGIEAAQTIKSALDDAFNVDTGRLDLTAFNRAIQNSGRTLSELTSDLQSLGPAGTNAFMALSKSISNAEMPLRRTSQLFDELWQSMQNAAKWNISTTVLNSFTGAIQSAYEYSKDLDESLTNIRIVTGQSREQMEAFADSANQAAHDLSASTLDYTNAALIYYQQGLNDEEVAARTATTIRAAQTAQMDTAEMSEYLTAIWNGFQIQAEGTEEAIDKVAAVATATAADLGELAEGFSRVASAAASMGVDIDELNSYLATVISVTREAPETIGTAFRTIFARLNSVSLGETAEDGVNLNTVGNTLEKVGIQVLDNNGKLRKTGEIIDEIGNRWTEFSAEQQRSIAITMAGTQQFSRLIALFDNWDMYQETLAISQNAAGTLQEQADIYADSWQAAAQRVQTSLQDLYEDFMDSDFFIGLLDGADSVVQGLNEAIDAVGGFGNALLLIVNSIAPAFHKQMVESVANGVASIGSLFGVDNKNAASIYQQQIQTNNELLESSKNLSLAQRAELESQNEILNIRLKAVQGTRSLTAEQAKQIENEISQTRAINDNIVALARQTDEMQKQADILDRQARAAINTTSNIERPDISTEDKEKQKKLNDQINSLQQANISGNDEALRQLKELQKEQQAYIDITIKGNRDILKSYQENARAADQLNAVITTLGDYGNFYDNQSSLEGLVTDTIQVQSAQDEVLKILRDQNLTYEQQLNALDELYNNYVRYLNVVDDLTPELRAQRDLIRQNSAQISETAASRAALNRAQQTVSSQKGLPTDNKVKKTVDDYAKLATTIVDVAEGFGSLVTISSQAQNAMEGFQTGDLVNGFTGLASGLGMTAFGVVQLQQAFSGLGGIIGGLGGSLGALGTLLTGPVGWAIAGVVGLVAGAIGAFNGWKQAQEEAAESAREFANEMASTIDTNDQQIQSLQELKSQYDELKTTYDETGEGLSDLQSIASNIVETYGIQGGALLTLQGNYDALSDSIDKTIEKMLEANATAARSDFLDLTRQFQNSAMDDSLTSGNVSGIFGSNRDLQDFLQNNYNFSDNDFGASGLSNVLSLDNENIPDFVDNYEKFVELRDNLRNDVTFFETFGEDAANKFIDSLTNVIEDRQEDYNSAVQGLQAYVDSNLADITYGVDFSTISDDELEELQQKVIDAFSSVGFTEEQAIAAFNDYVQETSAAAQQEIQDVLDSIATNTGTNVSKVESTYDSMNSAAQSALTTYADTVLNYDSLMKIAQAAGQQVDTTQLETTVSQIQSMISTLNSGGELDESDWNALPEELQWIQNLTDGQILQELQEALQEETSMLYSAYQQNQDALRAQYEAMEEYQQWLIDSGTGEELQQRLDEITQEIEDATQRREEALERGDDSLANALQNQINALNDESEGIEIQLGFTADEEEFNEQISELENQKVNLEIQLDTTAFDTALSQTQALADAALMIGENWQVAADDIAAVADAFPGILEGYSVTADGMIQLNSEVAQSALGLANTQAQSSRDAAIAELQSRYEVMQGYQAYLEAQLASAQAFRSGEITLDEYSKQAQANSQTAMTDYVKAKYGENAAAGLESATSQDEYIEALRSNTDLATDDIAQSFIDAYVDAATNSQQSVSAQITNLNALITAANAASRAVFNISQGNGAQEGTVANATTSGGVGSKTSTVGGTDRGTIGSLDTSIFDESDLTWDGYLKSNSDGAAAVDAYISQIKDAMSANSAAMNKTLAQVAELEAQGNITSNALQNAASGAGGSGSSGGGGGGGGSSAEEKKIEYLEEELDLYREINQKIEEQERLLGNLEEQSDRYYGQNRLNSLEEEQKMQEDLLESYKERAAIAEEIKNQNKEAALAVGAEFDDYGVLINYNQLLQDQMNKTNALIDAGASEEVVEANKDAFERLKEILDAAVDSMSQYHEYLDQIEDTAREIADLAFEQVTEKVEYEITMNEDDLAVLDYFINKNDEFEQTAERLELVTQKYATSAQQLQTYQDGIIALQEQLNDPNADHAAINDQIRDYRDAMIDALETLQDLEEEMEHAYADALDEAANELDKYTSQLENMNSTLQHFIDIMGLMGKETNYDTIGKILEGQISNYKDQLDVQQAILEGYYQQREAMIAAGQEGSDEWFALVDAIGEAEDQLYSLTEDTLQAIEDLYQNTVDNILSTLEESLSGSTFDHLQDVYDRYTEEQDRFLTKTEQLYELTQLQNKIQQDIDSTDNPARKEKLENLQEYVSGLMEQNKLSEYELKYAQAKYDLELKQMALEEAQNSKTNLRLVRNAQGNWSYQYTADQENIANAEAEYQEALNNMYQLSLDRVSELEQEIIDINKEMQEALAGIERDNYDTAEEYQAALLEVRQYYEQRMYDAVEQYNIARQNLAQDTYDLVYALTQDQILASEQAKLGFNQDIADMIDKLMGDGEDSFTNATDQAIEDLTQAWQDWHDNVQEVAEDVGVTEDDIIDKTGEVVDASQELADTVVDEVVPAIMDEIEAVRQQVLAFEEQRDAIADLIAQYEDFIRTLEIAEGQARETQQALEAASGAGNSINVNVPSSGNSGSNSGGGGGGGKHPSSSPSNDEDTEDEKPAPAYFTVAISPTIGQSDVTRIQYSSRATAMSAAKSAINGYGKAGVTYTYWITQHYNGKNTVTKYTLTKAKKTPGSSGGHGLNQEFDTGGYTGDWGTSEGRLATLHEKELVLNKEDTRNVLSAVGIMRQIAPQVQQIEAMIAGRAKTAIANLNMSFGDPTIGINYPGQDQLQQNVSINATFPNVSVASEIEQALSNLVNEAAQFVQRK